MQAKVLPQPKMASPLAGTMVPFVLPMKTIGSASGPAKICSFDSEGLPFPHSQLAGHETCLEYRQWMKSSILAS